MKFRNRIIGYFFVAVLFIAFFLIIIRPVIYILDHIDDVEAFDTLKAYPFKDTKDSEQISNSTYTLGMLALHINDIFDNVKGKIEMCATEKCYFQDLCIAASMFIDKLIGLDMTTSLSDGQYTLENLIIPYENDYLGYVWNNNRISDNFDNLVNFVQQMRNEGRNFLYFLVPGKYAGNEIYSDHSQEMHDLMIKSMKEAGIDIYDMWETIEENGISMSSLFFKSDHHWLPETGIWANKLLSEYLNNNYGYSIDTSLFDLDNYDITILEKNYLGSQGKKVSTIYSSIDDFPILIPKYNTDLEVFISDYNTTKSGSVQETLLYYPALKENRLYDRYSYEFYGYGERELISIHNKNISDGKRILFIKRSFADCMYPFFAAGVEYLDVIDLRVFKGSLQTYINETNPDTIVMVYGLDSFNDADFR